MELILLSKIENLGDLGDVVRVKSGYARNYLIPYGKAQFATPENLKEVERRRQELEQKLAEEAAAANQRAEKIGNTIVTVTANVGEEGKLFGSVGTAEIVEAIFACCGERVERSEIRLPEGVFRKVGEYEVSIKLHTDIETVINLHIVAQEQGKKE